MRFLLRIVVACLFFFFFTFFGGEESSCFKVVFSRDLLV